MGPKLNKDVYNTLAAAIVLIISVVLLTDKLLSSTNDIQLILEDGKAVPIEAVSYFSFNDVLFLIIAAWLGGMAFLYIILSSKESAPDDSKNDTTKNVEKNNNINMQLAIDMLEGDEQSLFKNVVENENILQKDVVLMTGFSEPKVSRLLNRLEKRGLIFRQRNGMGNRVLLKK